jgi:hypothetical protein
MTVELPKDAEGREIPLDVEFLYNANGESVKPYSFTFRRYDGFCWEMRLVGAPEDLVYETNSFYITPPDSFEKLEDDLSKIVNHPKKSSARISVEKEKTATAASSRTVKAPAHMPAWKT